MSKHYVSNSVRAALRPWLGLVAALGIFSLAFPLVAGDSVQASPLFQSSYTYTIAATAGSAVTMGDAADTLSFVVTNSGNDPARLIDYVKLEFDAALYDVSNATAAPYGWSVDEIKSAGSGHAFVAYTASSFADALLPSESQTFSVVVLGRDSGAFAHDTADQADALKPQQGQNGTIVRSVSGNRTFSLQGNLASWPRRGLAVSVIAVPPSIAVDDLVTVTMVVDNHSTAFQANIVRTLAAAPADLLTLSGGPIPAALALGPGASNVITQTYRAIAQGTATFRGSAANAFVTSDEVQSQEVVIGDFAALLEVVPSSIVAGQGVVLRMRVYNNGAGSLGNVRPSLPGFVGAASVAAFTGPSPKVVPSLPPGSTTTFEWTYILTGPVGSTYTFTGTASANGSRTTNVARSNSGVVSQYMAYVTPRRAGASSATPLSLAFTVANNGATTINKFEFALPAGFSDASGSGQTVTGAGMPCTWSYRTNQNDFQPAGSCSGLPPGGTAVLNITFSALPVPTVDTDYNFQVNFCSGGGACSQASGPGNAWQGAVDVPFTITRYRIQAVAAPSSLPADGFSTSEIMATVYEGGSPLPSAYVVFASTGTQGTLSAYNGTTNASGVVTVTFTAPIDFVDSQAIIVATYLTAEGQTAIALNGINGPNPLYVGGTLDPLTVQPGKMVAFRLGVVNTGNQPLTLTTSSTFTFTDGVRNFVANLAAPTTVPADAQRTLTFNAAPVDVGFAAGAYDPVLHLVGSGAGQIYNRPVSDAVQVLAGFRMEWGTVSVGNAWATVNLGNRYDDMVVVATPQYDNNTIPIVTRVRSAVGSSFQMRLQSPSSGTPVAETVHYVVMETGVYTLPNGIRIEAQKYNSTRTDGRNSTWTAEVQSYLQSYTNPVVVGQVMTYNDAKWSVYWDRGSSAANPPDAGNLWTGKMVSKDPDTTRAVEMIGFIVFEQSHGTVFGVEYEARLGESGVHGVVDAPPYVYNFSQPFASPPQVAMLSKAAEDGGDGAWSVLYGANPFSAAAINLALDEDAIGGASRSHPADEQVAYLVFEKPLVVRPAPFLEIVKSVSSVGPPGLILPGDALVYTLDYANNGMLAATGVVLTDQLPAQVVFQDASPGCTHDGSPVGGVVVCNVGILNPFEAGVGLVTVTVDVNIPAGTDLVNAATVDSAQGVSATTTLTTPVASFNVLKLETVTALVNHNWTTVNLSNSYNDVVVVCTPQHANNSISLVTRVRNAAGSSFQVRLQNPHASNPDVALNAETVHCVAMEAGRFTLPDGRKIEAQKYTSTRTDSDSSWVGEAQNYLQPYLTPVVLGQVMSYNDPDWSVFWARGPSAGDPPNGGNLWTGKMVGEDPDSARFDELIGFIVVEQGHGTAGDVAYDAWLGADSVQGAGDAPPYRYNFSQPFDAPPQVALASLAGMDGSNGGWAILYGPDPLRATSIDLAVDEDQIGDGERNHTTEQAAYLVFEESLLLRPTHDLHIAKLDDPDPATVGEPLAYTLVYTNSGVLTATHVVVSETYDGNVTFDSASVAPTVGDNVWSLGDLGPGASGYLVVTVTVNGGLPDWTTVTNTVTIASDQTAPVTATEATLVRAYVLELSKADAPDPVMVGDLLTYTLIYTNAGAGALTNLILTETYDSAVSFVSASVTPAVGNNVWHLGDLSVGEAGSIVITALVNGGGSAINRARMSSDQDVAVTATATTSVISLLKMEVFTTTADHNWTTVALSNTYNSMVVVCTPQYAHNALPLVTRVRNASAASFQVRLQNPHASNPNVALNAETVHCLVAEEGLAILPGGRRIEARKYSSTVTDHDSSWLGEAQSYLHTYTHPVVLGQVMSFNDMDWSVFWTRGASRTAPPDAGNLYAGKMVAEDWDVTRLNETIGLIVIEQGHDSIFDVAYEAWLGPSTVQGVGNSPPYRYNFDQPFDAPPRVALASQVTMNGANGSWAVLYGANPLSATAIDLAVDEDQIGDGERSHIAENVAYLVFEEPLVLRPSNDLAIFKTDSADPVPVGSALVYTVSYVNSGVIPAADIVITETYDGNVSFVAANPSPTAGNNVWQLGELAWGESGAVVITVTVRDDLPSGTILTNRASIDSYQTSPYSTLETTLVSAPLLQLAKSDQPDPVIVGGALRYTIHFTNSGVLTATYAVVTEAYDGNVSFVAANPGPTLGNNVWHLGDLSPGQAGAIEITVTVNGGVNLTNVATLDSDQTVPLSAVETTTVGTLPALHLAIADVPDPVLNNGVLVYNLDYWNTGSGDATGVVLTETVPANTTFNAAASAPGWSCPDGAPAGTVCTRNLGTLPPGPGGTVAWAVTVNGGTLLTNQAWIGSAEGVVASDSEQTTVLVPDQVTIDKTVSPSTVGTPGERATFDYAIVIHNAGPSDVPVQCITDTLPAGFSFITTTAAIGLPDPDATTVSGPDISWSYNAPYPSIAAGTSVSVTFVVTASNDSGVYCNDAAVTVGGDVGIVAGRDLACVTIGWPVYQIESHVGKLTIVVRMRLEPDGPVVLSWEILP